MQLTDHLWSRKCGEVGCKMKTQWYRFWNYSLKVLKCKYSVSFTFMLLIFSLCLCCFKPYNYVVKMWALEFWCKTKLKVDTVTAFSKLKNRLVSHCHRQLQRLFYCSELLENFCISFIHNCTADIPCISFYKYLLQPRILGQDRKDCEAAQCTPPLAWWQCWPCCTPECRWPFGLAGYSARFRSNNHLAEENFPFSEKQ